MGLFFKKGNIESSFKGEENKNETKYDELSAEI